MSPDVEASEAFEPFVVLDQPLPIARRQFALVSRSGACFTSGGPDAASFQPGDQALARKMTWLPLAQAVKRGVQVSRAAEPHILFHCPFSDGYYHWLIEAIPRLLSLREHWGEYRLIIPDGVPNPWFADWLQEISGGNCVVLRRGGLVARQVVFQHCGQRIDQFSPHAIQLLANYFTTRFGCADRPDGPRKVFISRARAGHRKLINEPQVLDCLTQRGFVSLILEEMSFADQVRAFAAADIVISIHGAGLANAVFMHPNTRLMELTQSPRVDRTRWRGDESRYLLNPCFRGLAYIRNVQHAVLFCEPHFASTPNEVLSRLGPLAANLLVDVRALSRKLDELSC